VAESANIIAVTNTRIFNPFVRSRTLTELLALSGLRITARVCGRAG
jgi:uncharacterized membrane protein